MKNGKQLFSISQLLTSLTTSVTGCRQSFFKHTERVVQIRFAALRRHQKNIIIFESISTQQHRQRHQQQHRQRAQLPFHYSEASCFLILCDINNNRQYSLFLTTAETNSNRNRGGLKMTKLLNWFVCDGCFCCCRQMLYLNVA